MNLIFVKNALRFTFVCALTCGSFTILNAQSIVGKWKRVSLIVVDKDGKSTDAQPMMEKAMPCTAKILYEFTSGGLQKTIISNDCKTQMAAMAALFVDVPYVFKGNKLTIKTIDSKSMPDAIYDLKVIGGTMTWNFDYVQNPKTPNPTKAKSMSIVYKKM